MKPDYLIVGSGLSALSFAALMAKSGKRVTVLETHYVPGGYGHTFSYTHAGDVYRFNAQFHYVWNCGPEQTVGRFLRKLDLDQECSRCLITMETSARNCSRRPSRSSSRMGSEA